MRTSLARTPGSTITRLEADQFLQCLPFLASPHSCRKYEVQIQAFTNLPSEERGKLRKNHAHSLEKLVDCIFAHRDASITDYLLSQSRNHIIGIYFAGVMDLNDKLVKFVENGKKVDYPAHYPEDAVRDLIKFRLTEYCW